MGKTRRFKGMALAGLMVSALCGCAGLTAGEKQGLTQFGTSTASYADKVSAIATATQIDIRKARLEALGFPTAEAEKHFESVIKDDDSLAQYLDSKPPKQPGEKKSVSLSDHIAMMNGLASGLKDYGQALVDLANYGDPSGRLNTVQGIATNLLTVMQSSAAEQAQAKAISTVIGLIGNEIIEAVKKQSIKQTVAAFSEVVKIAAAILRAEFVGEREGTLAFAYTAAIDAYANRLPKADPRKSTEAKARQLTALSQLQAFEDKDSAKIAAAYVAFCAAADTRREISLGRDKLLNMRARLEAMKEQGLAATNALDEANNKMTAALANGSLSVADIQDFAQKTAAFAQAIKSIK